MSFLKHRNVVVAVALLLIVLLTSFKFVNDNEVVGLKHPESIAIYNGYLYVSNIGSSPANPDLDGFITRLDRYGNILEYKFIDKLKAPKGLFVYKNSLFIADLDRVCVVDLITKKRSCFDIKGAKFLNDIYVINSTAFVTDTANDVVYALNNGKATIFCRFEKGFEPNGITYSKKLNAFLVVSFSSPVIDEISVDGKILKSFRLNGLSGFDGISIYKDKIFLSDYRTGRVVVMDFSFDGFKVVKDFHTPAADILVSNAKLYAPLLEDNRLVIGKLK
ncbi:hypothetical protein [Hippea jasoniae]|uniref:hypothetical protein n=1 Tax=Hippea jasoniae TaxID=944479 RepID=UPI00068FDCB4|nr:hypothetical protein [Hippea jasoniae]